MANGAYSPKLNSLLYNGFNYSPLESPLRHVSKKSRIEIWCVEIWVAKKQSFNSRGSRAAKSWAARCLMRLVNGSKKGARVAWKHPKFEQKGAPFWLGAAPSLICVIRCQRRRKITRRRSARKSGETRYRAQQVFSPLVCLGFAVYIKHISDEEGGTNLKGLSARSLATPLTHSRSPCRKSERGVIDEPPARV